MSEPSAGAADVTASPTEQSVEQQPQPEGQSVEQQPQPEGQAVAQRPLGEAAQETAPAQEQTSGGPPFPGNQELEGGSAASAQATDSAASRVAGGTGTGDDTAGDGDGAAPEPPEDSLEEAIDKLEEEAAQARAAKEQADSASSDKDNRLASLQAVQREFDATLKAYESAYSQLDLQQKAYVDYLESEKESLEDLLGAVADEVDKKAEARDARRAELEQDVKAKIETLKAAEDALSASKNGIKMPSDRLGQVKRLAATVTARHGNLKALRDEETKARQLGQYALAYWLLDRGFRDKLTEEPKVIKPDQLEAALIAAVGAVAEAQAENARNEKNVAKSRDDLAQAQKSLDEHKTKSEAELRAELQQMQTNDAATRGDTDNA